MTKWYSLVILAICSVSLPSVAQTDSVTLKMQAFEASFTYHHGTVKIGNGIGVVKVPPGFKYLDSIQAKKVLIDLWGNPKESSSSLGFIMPEKQNILDQNGYVFNIQYDPIGYVKDHDADDINYDDLLGDMKKEAKDESTERVKNGYGVIEIVGWASKPYYDPNEHVLHWAKEIKFGADTINTLNYNVRVLGRKGVLIVNAIATMNELSAVKASIPGVLGSVRFEDGYKYAQFDSGVDEVAAWTIGGLVAGKVLAKVGFFALLLKFWKLIAVAFVAAATAIRKFFGLKKSKQVDEGFSNYASEPVIGIEEANVTSDDTEVEEPQKERRK